MPLCSIQMPDVEIYNPTEFNVKLIFHPQTGITQEEQLLCTAAAVAFVKDNFSTNKKNLRLIYANFTENQNERIDEESRRRWEIHRALLYFRCYFYWATGVIFYVLMDKWGCEYKKAKGYSAYQGRRC